MNTLYAERRAQLARAMGSGLLLFLGHRQAPINYRDNTYRFRQDSTFHYFFGTDYADLAAVIDIDEGRTVLFGDDLTLDDIVWTGFHPTLHEKGLAVGVSDTRPLAALAPYLKGRDVQYLPPYRGETSLWLYELLSLAPREQTAHASLPLIKAVVEMRNHKTPYEIAQIEEAVDISVEMHLAAYRAARPGTTEAQVAAEVERVVMRHGCFRAFPTIATVHGQTLHQHAFTNTLREGQIFLLDAGAENADLYAGDLSSSMPVAERFTPQQADIYQLHLETFGAAVRALAPGRPFREAHMAAAVKLCEGMCALGLMQGDPVEAAYAGAYALFFPCGLGHMMGLDVHDMENLGEEHVGYGPGETKSTQFGFKSLRLARRLEPGFVFTIEPGIYFIPQLIDRWQAEHRFADFIRYDRIPPYRTFGGLRNELNYLCLTDGVRRLGRLRKPMTIEEVYEAAYGGRDCIARP